MWQPIDSAPKDGKPLLGFNVKLRVPFMVFWMDQRTDDLSWFPCIMGVGELYGKDFASKAGPTHWMPLPDKPRTD